MALTTEERLKLMRDIGMMSAADQLIKREEARKEIERLTKMTFKRTDVGRIRKQLCGHFFEFRPNGFIVGAIGMTIAFAGLLYFRQIVPPPILMLVFFMVTVFWLTQFIHESVLGVEWLTFWKDSIPVGAALAVKEAQAAGLRDFAIYYPITKEEARLRTDPVIVGFSGGLRDERRWLGGINADQPIHNGLMFEVFAWDDGKVYESLV